MDWIEACVNTESREIDGLCDILAGLGVTGVSIEDEADLRRFLEENRQFWDYVDDTLTARFRGVSRVKFYVEDTPEGRQLLKTAEQALAREVRTAIIKDEDWANSWKQAYAPIPAGRRLLVVPEWLRAEEPGRTALRLEPGLTFGTGSHATTRMCLTALEDYAAPGRRALDLGCGSGILAIAALLLGCDAAAGCDIDPKSPDAARANAALNGIGEERLRLYAGNVLTDEGLRRSLGGPYDIVLANIVADVILPLAGFVRRFLKPGGAFICSGIIENRASEVEAELKKQGFRVVRHLSEEEWNAFVCE